MRVVEYEQTVHTRGRRAVVDLTPDVAAAVRRSGIANGVACLWSPHTSCRLRFAACEAGLDERLAPAAGNLLAVQDGELVATGARRILLVELDRERERRWLLQIVGD